MMADLTGDTMFKGIVKGFCDHLVHSQQRTPQGMVFIQPWGSNRHAANVAFACLAASTLLESFDYNAFAKQQIDLLLGDAGRSYVVGFGKDYPKRPHHRGSSCPTNPRKPCDWNQFMSPDPNPNILYGALVGGPAADGSYQDKRGEYIKNSVAIDHNAGFQSAVAGLITLAADGKLWPAC